MAISAATLRGRLRSTANGSATYTTGSATAMGANHLALAFVSFSISGSTTYTNPSGYGITWEDVSSTYSAANFVFKSPTNGMSCNVYAGLTGAGTGSGTFSISPGTAANVIGCNITTIELTGDFSGASTAVEAILQLDRTPATEGPATSRTPSLTNAPDSDSRTVGYWGANVTGSVTLDGDWTSLDNASHSTPSNLMCVAWNSSAADQTATGSWGASNVSSMGMLLEMAEVPATTTPLSGFNVGMIE